MTTGNTFAVLADDYEFDFWKREELAAILGHEKEVRIWEKEPGPLELFPQEQTSACENDTPPSFQHLIPYHSKAIDPSVKRRTYMKWRTLQTYKENPTDITNPYFTAMIKCGWSAYYASHWFTGKDMSLSVGPGWCFHRFGRSRTVIDCPVVSLNGIVLEPGTKIFIGGQHEDSYDFDYLVYNDVTVVRPDGTIRVYGYPHETFLPTDGHTATLIGTNIFIIGSCGYKQQRGTQAQVCVLDLTTMQITQKITTGDDPGWISDHTVTRVEHDTIEIEYGLHPVRGSKVAPGKWILHLGDMQWKESPENAERTSMDEASQRGLPEVLERWKNRGEPYAYSENAMDDASAAGHVNVLQWWKDSGLPCKWTTKAMDNARGYWPDDLGVLNWWKGSGLELKWTEETMDGASKEGNLHVLNWWKTSGLECRYTCRSIHWAAHNGRIDLLDWWKASGFPLEMDYPMDEASDQEEVSVLEWFKNSGLPLQWSEKAMERATLFGFIEVLEWWKNSGLECKFPPTVLKTCQLLVDRGWSRSGLEWWTENIHLLLRNRRKVDTDTVI